MVRSHIHQGLKKANDTILEQCLSLIVCNIYTSGHCIPLIHNSRVIFNVAKLKTQ